MQPDSRPSTEMKAQDAVELLELFDRSGIEVWVDGGWCVDALLGEQTRPHRDLDIAIRHQDVPLLRALLAARRYRDVPAGDTRECNFVLGDNKGRRVDVHSFTFDAAGNNIFGVAYLPHHLTGSGTIRGYPVRCIPPDVMIEFHRGYEPDEEDYHDVLALSRRYGLKLPAEYRRFQAE